MDDKRLDGLSLPQLVAAAQGCAVCANDLPCGPRPLLQAGRSAAIMIIGQAPGRRAHDSGTPWDDASGQRLRDWLGVSEAQFYDSGCIALMPMGFCYPGTGASGDLPPRPECAPRWHNRLLNKLPKIELTVLIGRYAIDHYAEQTYRTLTEAVADHARFLPDRIVLPHPSPRNNRWLAKNPWFAEEVLPKLRRRVSKLVQR